MNEPTPPTEEEIQKLEEKEYTRLIDQDVDAQEACLGCDAFDTKSYKSEYRQHVIDCMDAIYNQDEPELGRLIMYRANKYLRELARENVG